MKFLKHFKFNVHDVLAALRDPLGSAKALAAGIITFGVQNGVDLPSEVDAAFTDLVVAAVVAFAAWVVPNYPKRDRVLD